MAQWIKDPVVLLQQLGSLLWHRFHPWPKNFHMPWVWQNKKKEKTSLVPVTPIDPNMLTQKSAWFLRTNVKLANLNVQASTSELKGQLKPQESSIC